MVGNEPQIEEIYLSSDNGDKKTGDSNIIKKIEIDDISIEIPEDENKNTHEEDKNKNHASPENIPPDPKNGAVQEFLPRKLKLGQSSCILKKGMSDDS